MVATPERARPSTGQLILLLVLGPAVGVVIWLASYVLIPDRIADYVGGTDPFLILAGDVVAGFAVVGGAMFAHSRINRVLIPGAVFAVSVFVSVQLLMDGHPCC